MKTIKLYRRRFIPDETVLLKDDVIEYADNEIIITRWKVLRPKKEFAAGRSCYFMNDGYKVSYFFDGSGRRVYTYCDIISTTRDTEGYIFTDLLVDVVVHNNGDVRVLDLAEISEALDRGLITVGQAKEALTKTDNLLSIIYSGGLERLTKHLDAEEVNELT